MRAVGVTTCEVVSTEKRLLEKTAQKVEALSEALSVGEEAEKQLLTQCLRSFAMPAIQRTTKAESRTHNGRFAQAYLTRLNWKPLPPVHPNSADTPPASPSTT